MKTNQEIIEGLKKKFSHQLADGIRIESKIESDLLELHLSEALEAKEDQHKQGMIELVESFDEDWWEHPIEWKNEQLNQLKG